jgi:polyhydroxyalkanoate synthase
MPETNDHEIREQAAANTLAANPLVGVRGEDLLDAVHLLLGQMTSRADIAAQQYLAFLGELGRIAAGASELAPDAKDKRFADPAWKQSPTYRTLAQCYLAWGGAFNRFVDDANMEKRDAERVRFVTSLFIDAMAPTNSLAGNPAALKKFIDTGGSSLAQGLENFVHDLINNGGLPAQVDTRNFAVGKNLATTPGAVVYRNSIMELIQYQPTGAQVHARPLLVAAADQQILRVRPRPGEEHHPPRARRRPADLRHLVEKSDARAGSLRARCLCRSAGGSGRRDARHHRS